MTHYTMFSIYGQCTRQLEASWDLGCLPFTWVNRSVHGLGNWRAKLRTGKFRPGIAFTICTNQFHLLEKDDEGLKLVSKMALKKWNTYFLLEYSVWKKQDYFFSCFAAPGNFPMERPKKSCSFLDRWIDSLIELNCDKVYKCNNLQLYEITTN